MARPVPPKSIIDKLRERYNVPFLDKIISDFLEEVIRYSIENVFCRISNFGKFVAYKTYCNKSHKIRPRFKFRPSGRLIKQMANDDYIMSKLKITYQKQEFTDEQMKRCDPQIKKLNAHICEASNSYRDKDPEQHYAVKKFIENIIDSEDSDDNAEK